MSKPALLLAIAAVTLLSHHAGAQDKAKPTVEESAKKVKELQKERIATLKAIVDASSILAQKGKVDVREAVEDVSNLKKAELEFAEKESERIALLKEGIDALKSLEQMATVLKEAGRGTELDVNKAKVRRLELEILLEQAKAKEAKERK